MKKKIVSALLALSMAAGYLFSVPAFADDDKFSGGSGTQDDPYLISTAEDMWELSNDCNSGSKYESKYFKMTEDIDLGCSESKQWTPIGRTPSEYFAGMFDGDGHTVTGLYINNNENYQGFFGYCMGTSIKNLTVEGNITANSAALIAGGLIGTVSVDNCCSKGNVTATGSWAAGICVPFLTLSSVVTNCRNEADVTGSIAYSSSAAAGIVTQNAHIKSCVNTGNISGVNNVGGIIGGSQYGTCEVQGCVNTGRVTGTGSNIGGIAGRAEFVGDGIKNNCNTGNVSGGSSVGGIWGAGSGSVRTESCYNTGNISGSRLVGGISGETGYGCIYVNCYNLGDISASGYGAGGILGAWEGFNPDNDASKFDCLYNLGKVTANSSYDSIIGQWHGENGHTANITNALSLAGLCDNNETATIVTAEQLASASTYSNWTDFNNIWELNNGAGRPILKNPREAIEISDVDELIELVEEVNSGNPYNKRYIELTDDIDLDGIDWFPIGSYDTDENSARPFLGNFNGNGHTISNLNCDAGSEEYQGFFGYIGAGGSVKNLTIDDSCFFSAGEHTAAFAGLNAGTIENCKNYAEVIGDEYTGGIVGENDKGGLVTKCYNTGAISSTASEVGGIAGYNVEATVSECVNDGAVDADVSFAGGVVGQNHTGTITNCLSTGEIRAVRAYTGGVVGQTIGSGAKVSNCYSYGRVYSYEICGGVAGSNKNDSVIEKCYYLEDTADGGISGENSPRSAQDVSGSAQKLMETQFKDQSSFSGWNFSNIWIMVDRPYLDCALILKLEGSGTEDDPYLINEADDFDNVRLVVNAGKLNEGTYFLMTDDIDLEDESFIPIGTSYTASFKGVFDGGEHTLSGLNIQYDSSITHYGLFGYVTGTVKNLKVEGNINIISTTKSDYRNIGGIAGTSNGTVENCSFSGIVNRNLTGRIIYMGGIAGYNGQGTIKDCYFEGELHANSQDQPNRDGGIAGMNDCGTISRCYNSGTIDGGDRVGGITAECIIDDDNPISIIDNSYNTGDVLCKSSSGTAAGIAGNIQELGTRAKVEIRSCHNAGKISGGSGFAIIGRRSDGASPKVSNCYYLEGSSAAGSDAAVKSENQFGSGEVAYLLQNGQSEQAWGQTLAGDEADEIPVLTKDTNKAVHKITYSTKSNSNYATGYGTGEGVASIPSYSGSDFIGWSLTNSANVKMLTEYTPITSDITVYAVSQEMYGEKDSDKTLRLDYGKGGSVDLSEYIVYQNGTATKGKYTYTIDSGNSSLKATVSGDTLTIPTSAPVGTYNLSVTATEKAPNISLMSVSFDNLPVTMDITVIVGKRDATVTAPKAKSLTYNGSQQELVTAGTTTGGTLMYSLDGKNYSTDIPKGKNAGTYTVYYKLDGGEEFNDIEPKTVIASIMKAVGRVDTPVLEPVVYGTRLGDIKLPDGWSWLVTNPFVIPSVTDNGYKISYHITDFDNYSWDFVTGYDITTKTITRTINIPVVKADPIVTPPAGKSLKTTGEIQELIYAGKTTGGTLVYSLDGKTYSTDIPKAREKGNYTVYYKVIGDDNYNDTEPQTITAELGKADIPADKITYPQAKKYLEYNGEERELITAGTAIEGTKFLYSLDNRTYSEEIPTATSAGTYVVYYKIDGGELYNDIPTRAVNVAIAKQDLLWFMLLKIAQLSDKVYSQDLTYGIKLSDIELTDEFEWVDDTIIPEVDYAYDNGYPAIMHIEDDENYDWDGIEGYDKEKHIWSVDLPFAMVKADIANVTAPAARELTYSGNAQELVTRGSAEGGTVEYSLDGKTYSDTIPTGTNADEYTVYYKVIGDSNHNDTEAKTVKVTIAKKKPRLAIPFVIDRSVVYGTKLSEISLSGGWAWVNGNTVPTVNNNGYDAKIAIDYDANYDWESIEGYDSATDTVTRTLAVMVRKAPSNVNIPEGITATYGDTLAEVTLPSGWTWDNPTQSVGNAGTRLFAATYTPDDTDNYEGINTNISVEVTKSDPVVTAPEAKDITYTGLAQELVTAASTTGGTLLYSIDGDNYFTSVPKGRNAGDYTVYYKVEGDGNYNDVEEHTIKVTINKASLNLTVQMPNWTLGGDKPEPVISGNISGGTVTYEYKVKDANDSTYITSKPNTDGEFTVRAAVAATDNYNSATATADFTVYEAEGAPVANILTYDGSEQELVTAENDEFVYSLDGETYTQEIPTATNAGTYTVYYTIGNSSAKTIEVTISPAIPELTEPEIPESVVYGKHLYEIPLSDRWMWANGDIVPDVNNAGYEAVYYIRADEEDESYKNFAWSNVEGFDEENLTITRMISVNITKADMSATLPRVKMRTYNGAEQELVTAGTVQGGQMLYSLNGTDYTTNVPTGVDAKTYTVYYKAVGDANHNNGASGNLTVTIFQKDAELTEPTLSSVTYGTKLSEIPLPEGWEWTDETITPIVTNSGYEAKYTVTTDPNYSWARVEGYDSETGIVTRILALTVNKANTAPEIPTSLTATYGDTLSNIELPQGWEWQDSEISVGNAGTHTFTAVYTPLDLENYEILESDVTITVSKTQSAVTEPEPKTLVYTGANQELITAPEVTGGTVLYSLDGEKYSTAVPSGKDAGEYTVYYKVKGDENHLDTEPETVAASIDKADIPLDILMLSWYEGEESSEPIIYGNTGQGDVTYEYKPQNSDDSEYSETMPTAYGVYKIKATAAETKNYNGATVTSYFAIMPSENGEEYALLFIDDYLYITAPHGGPCTVIFAAYKNGILQNVSCEEKVFSDAGADIAVMPEKMKAGEPDEIRAMLWNNMTDMMPLCKTELWSGLD